MSSSIWRRVDELYAAAPERNPADSGSAVDPACTGEPAEVRTRVEALLQTPEQDDERWLAMLLTEMAQEIQEVVDRALLPEGTRLLDRYTIRSFIGRGGEGDVYKATDDKFDHREVAVKVIWEEIALAGGPKARDRFKTEANALALLKDERFVRVYDTGEWGQRPFLVMELIDGPSLEEAELEPRKAARLIASLAGAMSHAHALDIVHLDLTPANVLLIDPHRPKITDFGLAKRLGKTEGGPLTGVLMGTPSYMAPEKANGNDHEVGPRTDVYGLGAILYKLLTGQPPFVARTDSETLEQVRNQRPQPPCGLNRRVDLDLQAVCLKCLEKKPDDRYCSTEELAKDLERWLDGRETSPRPWGFVERALRAFQRYPVAAALTAAAAALLVATAVTAVSVARVSKEQLEEERLRSNAYAAYGIASTVLLQLEDWSNPVVDTAQDQELRGLLTAGGRGRLQHYLEKRDRFLREGKRSPFESWVLVDKEGKLLAVLPKKDHILGVSYAGRDYFRGAMRHAREGRTGRDAVHISRVFKADDDKRYKFAISAPVRDGDVPNSPVLGVMVVTITTNSTLGLVQMGDERRRAVLIGQGDTAPPRPGAEPGAPPGYLILVHPDYKQGADVAPVPSNNRIGEVSSPHAGNEFQLQEPDAFDPGDATESNYTDPSNGKRQLVGFAQVGNTELIVMVQQPYDEAVQPHLRWGVILVACIGAATFFGLLLAGVVARSVAGRIRDRAGGGFVPKPAGEGDGTPP
jgi:eukaryotic-like serine/threonine-protein kinase